MDPNLSFYEAKSLISTLGFVIVSLCELHYRSIEMVIPRYFAHRTLSSYLVISGIT